MAMKHVHRNGNEIIETTGDNNNCMTIVPHFINNNKQQIQNSSSNPLNCQSINLFNQLNPLNQLMTDDGSQLQVQLNEQQQLLYRPVIEIVRPIGRGQFSDVYKAIWLNPPSLNNNLIIDNKNSKEKQKQNKSLASSLTVALKRIKIIDMRDAKARRDCLKETELLQQLDHENIVRYYTSFIDSSDLFIVLELADGGDLSKLIKGFRQRQRFVPERTIWKYFRQLASAVSYMHSKRVLHRDIKPANVFMTSNGCVKLGDFGLGRYFGPQTLDAHTLVGTFYYMSPERIRHDGYTFSSDVWSVGCVLYELATLRPPFLLPQQSNINNINDNINDNGLQALIERIENAQYEPICPIYYSYNNCDISTTTAAANNESQTRSQILIELVNRCLQAQAKQRPTMDYVSQLANWCFDQHQQQQHRNSNQFTA